MSDCSSGKVTEPADDDDGKRGSRDLESVLEYASRIRAFVGLVDDERPPPPLPKPLDQTLVGSRREDPQVEFGGAENSTDLASELDEKTDDLIDSNPLDRRENGEIDLLKAAPLQLEDEEQDSLKSDSLQKEEQDLLDKIPINKNEENDTNLPEFDSPVRNKGGEAQAISDPHESSPKEGDVCDSENSVSSDSPKLVSKEVKGDDELREKAIPFESQVSQVSNAELGEKSTSWDWTEPVGNGVVDGLGLNGEPLGVNHSADIAPEVSKMDSGFIDEKPTTILLDNDCQAKNIDQDFIPNSSNSDNSILNCVINNGFQDEDCEKNEVANKIADDQVKNSDDGTGDPINNEELHLVKGGNEELEKEENVVDEAKGVEKKLGSDPVTKVDDKPASNDQELDKAVSADPQNCAEIESKAEVFLFDTACVEGLQKEDSPQEDSKPPAVPHMALLRRLSKDVVNKVMDDAGSQIREMLDKRPTLEPNDPVENLNAESLYPAGMVLNPLKSHKEEFEVEENEDADTLCGMGGVHPSWLQPFATAKTYMALYSVIGMLSGAYYTYLIGTISTLEKRFAFKSKISGSIMIVDEITPLLLGVLVGYFGGKAHRPRMVALGMLLSAICCFVSAMPYFVYGPATHLQTLNVRNESGRGALCESERVEEACDADDRPPTLAAVLFLLLGSFLKGFGNLAYYAIGLAYMDDNAKKKNTPMYFAVSMSLRLVGPLLGFLLSSACLKFYENPFIDPGFGREDPRWIGAWWIGFVIQGVLLLIFVVPIALFPRRIAGHRSTAEDSLGQPPDFKGLLAALKRLGKNPLFVFIVINTIMAVFGGFGHYIMLPRYMENQFHMSASDASLLSGPPGLAAVMTSTIIGGYLIWKFKPSPKILTAGMIAVEVVAVVGFLFLMIPQCDRVQMKHFGLADDGLILDSACNADCNCTTASYAPVCGPDGKTTYFSPCHGGCSESTNKTFRDCSCIPGESSVVTEGYCAVEGCWTQTVAYIVTLPIMQLIVSLMRVAHTMVLLRSIEPDDKSVALGTFEALLCAFGFIPFPIVYGALVDSTCLVWERSCGRTGNCWFYDVERFNYLLHGSAACFSSMSVLCLIVIFLLSGRVNNLYDEEETVAIEKGEKMENNCIKI